MTKKQTSFLLASAIFFFSAFLFEQQSETNSYLDKYVRSIEHYVHNQETAVAEIVFDRDYVLRQSGILGLTEAALEDEKKFLQIYDKLFTVCVYKNDSLVFWTNKNVQPFPSEVAQSFPGRSKKGLRLANGYYEVLRNDIMDSAGIHVVAFGMIPIRRMYTLQSEYLENYFVGNPDIPANVGISEESGRHPVKSKEGDVLGYISSVGHVADYTHQSILSLLLLGGFIFLGFFLNLVAVQLVHRRKTWQGAAFLMLSVFGLRYIGYALQLQTLLSMVPLFARSFSQTLFAHSLGDLLFNIIILLWIMLFFHRRFRIPSYDHLSKPARFALSTLFYFAIFLALLLLLMVFFNLVMDSGQTFDFDNVFNLSIYSLLALVGVVLMLLALFLFSHRMMQIIVRIGFQQNIRVGALLLAGILTIPLIQYSGLYAYLLYLLAIAFIFILLLDYFIHTPNPGVIWLVLWLVIFSAISSTVLFRFNKDFDLTTRNAYAKALAEPRDTMAELGIREFRQSVEKDLFIRQYLASPFPFHFYRDELLKKINKYYGNNYYLFNHYTPSYFGYYQSGEVVLNEQTADLEAFEKKKKASQLVGDGLYVWTDDAGHISYLTQAVLSNDKMPGKNLLINFEYKREEKTYSNVYTELLLNKQYKNLQHLDRYTFAIYRNEKLTESQDREKHYERYLTGFELPKIGRAIPVDIANYSELVYRGDKKTVVCIGKIKSGAVKPLSLFSYLFTLTVLMVVLLSLINTFVPFLPDLMKFSIPRKPPLSSRIQLAVISLSIISFLLIGIVTVVKFKVASESYYEGKLEQKINSVSKNAEQFLGNRAIYTDSIELLKKLTARLSEIHQMDVNMYNPKGLLVSTSEQDIFDKGIITRNMEGVAYQALTQTGSLVYKTEEKIGNLTYKSAYIAMKDSANNTLCFLQLPYYSKSRELRAEVSDFLGVLMNVYIFLLLIASGIAIVVGNSITRPIVRIGEKLKQFKLGNRNEPLEWESKDELGDLIAEYNRLIHKLDENTEQLVRAKQEEAWREMAKQVAHEIKNPLTPMKLSIQYLQHAYKTNPDDLESLLKRVTKTLTEQIDNLSRIATEFSNFAKMPSANNQKLLLNDLVASVNHLFSEHRDTEFTLHLPQHPLYVFADRNQLVSVFNNLIKNALQAIPEGRRGRIMVELYEQNDFAVVHVGDNGQGIPEDMRDKVFMPNFTTKNTGSGIGLALTKNIVQSVNGKLYFESEPGIGTHFYVELPLLNGVL